MDVADRFTRMSACTQVRAVRVAVPHTHGIFTQQALWMALQQVDKRQKMQIAMVFLVLFLSQLLARHCTCFSTLSQKRVHTP
jgi:hypothetical protein